MAVPPVLSDLVSAPNAPSGSGQGGRTAALKFYEIPDNLIFHARPSHGPVGPTPPTEPVPVGTESKPNAEPGANL
jgi:hypothetical protein